MLERIAEIKDKVVNNVKTLGIVRIMEIGSGVAVLFGAILIRLSSDNELMATDILENYDSEPIETDSIVVDNETDSEE